MDKIVVVGAAVVDVLVKSDGLKVMKSHEVEGGVAMCEVLGGKLEAEESLLSLGGGAINVGTGLRKLGAAVKMVSGVGNDDLGELVIKMLEREGMDTSLIQRGKGKTGLSVVLISKSGARSIVTYRGESGKLDSSKIDWEEVKKADWIQVSSLGGGIQLMEDIVNFSIENGIKVGINPGKKELEDPGRLLKLVPLVDFFSVNRMEAGALVDEKYEDELAIIKKLANLGAKTLAVTDGKKGASLLQNRRWLRMEAFSVESVDDTGAGDAFVSGVVSGILSFKNQEEILKRGLANGAAEVTKLGSKQGLLDRDSMNKWLKKRTKLVEEWV